MKLFRKRYLAQAISLMGLGFLLTGCGANTPLNQLKSNHSLRDMTPAFWSEVHHKQPKLWQAAVAYCQQQYDKPNCGAVMEIFMLDNGSTKVPAYGSSGHPLEIPKF